jgi:hypothetical protein
MARCAWALSGCVALLLSMPPASAALTSINTFGDGGSERCLVGNGSDRCTKGGAYLGAYSITHLFSASTGRNLVRVDDNADMVWNAGNFGYIEVAGIAHYLSTNGTSSAGIWVDDGRFSASELKPFPAGTELSPDNRTLGVLLPGEKVKFDILTGRDFNGSFVSMALGAAAFEFVYRSRLPDGRVEYYSSDSTSAGFNNRIVSGTALDHMVTWYAGQRVDSQHNTANVYLIAFERAHQDDDFQDGVYAISIPTVSPVPEPPIWTILTLGFALTAWLRSQRSR